MTTAITERAERLRSEKEALELAKIDISLPGTAAEIGSLHPLTQMLDRGIRIFRRMESGSPTMPPLDRAADSMYM